MLELIIATRNAHKVGEIAAILGPGVRCISLSAFPNPPKIVEDAPTFAGNATAKAIQVANWLVRNGFGLPHQEPSDQAMVLADDSGLEVDAINGAPGVHSARFSTLDSGASGNASDADNNAKLLKLLKDVPQAERTARFRCVLALTPVHVLPPQNASTLCMADELELETQLFQGVCEGRIAFAPSGKGGFGYDPLFIPNGYTESFAELGEGVKNQISHRARALATLKEALQHLNRNHRTI